MINCLHVKEPFADWRAIGRLKIFNLQVLRSIFWSKKYLNADWKTACRLQKFLQIEEPFADGVIVCRLNNYSIGQLKNDLQIKEVFNLQAE